LAGLLAQSLAGQKMKERRRTIPPKLKLVSATISDAIDEARRIKELSIQEEVLVEWTK